MFLSTIAVLLSVYAMKKRTPTLLRISPFYVMKRCIHNNYNIPCVDKIGSR